MQYHTPGAEATNTIVIFDVQKSKDKEVYTICTRNTRESNRIVFKPGKCES